jgi:hypothetical protein
MRIELTTNPLELQLCDAVEFSYRIAGEFLTDFVFDLLFQEEPRRVVLKGIVPRSVTVTEPRARLQMFGHQFSESPRDLERRAVAIWFTSRLHRDLDLKPAIERAIETKRVELSTTRPPVPSRICT